MKRLHLNEHLNMEVHDIIGNMVVDIICNIDDQDHVSKYRCSVYTKAAYLGYTVLLIVEDIEKGKLYRRLKDHNIFIWETNNIKMMNYLDTKIPEGEL